MVKLNIELDDETFAALLHAAEQSGIDVRQLRDAATHGTGATLPKGRNFSSWESFFQWVESLNIRVKGNLASREEIYDR